MWMTCYEKNRTWKTRENMSDTEDQSDTEWYIILVSKLSWCWIIILPLHFSIFDIRSFIILILSIPLPQTSHNTRVLLNNPSVPSVMIKHPNFSLKKTKKEEGKRFKFLPLMSNSMSKGSCVSFSFFIFHIFYVLVFHTVDSTLYLSTCNDEYIMAFCPEFLHMSACPLS